MNLKIKLTSIVFVVILTIIAVLSFFILVKHCGMQITSAFDYSSDYKDSFTGFVGITYISDFSEIKNLAPDNNKFSIIFAIMILVVVCVTIFFVVQSIVIPVVYIVNSPNDVSDKELESACNIDFL